jgi:uncharacterized membrane protein
MSKDDLYMSVHEVLGRLERAEEILELIRQQIDLANDANRQMAMQLADEHRRAEAAEKERDEWRQACLAHGEKAERAERQRDEAIAASDARAEAMREEAAKKAKIAWLSFGYGEIADADLTSQLCEYAESLIRAIPIPTQEVK